MESNALNVGATTVPAPMMRCGESAVMMVPLGNDTEEEAVDDAAPAELATTTCRREHKGLQHQFKIP